MADLEVLVDGRAGGPPCGLAARLVVPATHPVLAGHFPGAPLVPGVLLLDGVRRAWELARDRRATLVGVDDARWFAPVAPAQQLTLAANATASEDGGLTLVGEWRADTGRVASFVLRLVEAPAP